MQTSRGFASFVLLSALSWLGIVMGLSFAVPLVFDQSMRIWAQPAGWLGMLFMFGGAWASQFFRVPIWNIPLPRFRRAPHFTAERTLIYGLAALISAANFVFSIVDR
ncbi:hypothetical protein AE618_00135 [Bosea vaviloviae]|jgi:hypothetical protein|uniref:Uncharacterized protein n=1 Tax=Bosea vaviloviae TaxID=1526658 RepID=A0A0N1F6K6_9HYPH|nr:hypothetical protein AE618_00135 [Bosea vaviloviae]